MLGISVGSCIDLSTGVSVDTLLKRSFYCNYKSSRAARLSFELPRSHLKFISSAILELERPKERMFGRCRYTYRNRTVAKGDTSARISV